MSFFNPTQHDEGEDNALVDINIVPLVDIVLVLLIVFMIAAPLSLNSLPVDLPTSAAKGKAPTESKIILTITSEGKYYFDRLAVAEHELAEKLKTIFQLREDKELFISADEKVVYKSVINAMSAAKLANIHKMSLLTSPKG